MPGLEIDDLAEQRPAEASHPDQPGNEESTGDGSPPREGDRPKLLLVDDEENILRSLHRLLRKDFDITTASSPREALSHLHENTFAAILSDQRMPVMEGTELLAEARKIAPDTVRIILTGHADLNAVMGAINKGAVYRFLSKPWIDDELVFTLQQAVEQYNLVHENRRLLRLTEEQNQKLQAFNKNLREKVFERTRQVTRLNINLTQGFRGTIDVLARLADMNSPALGRHAKRVSDLSTRIGRAFGLEKEVLDQLEVAATLHDIGKVGLSPEILHRRYSELKPRDRAILLMHASRGATLIQMIPNMELAASFVLHHHENFDGTGYPKQLRGDQIPIGARIITVANGFDNTLNGRKVYNQTSPDQALQHLRDHANIYYDPQIVEALYQVLQSDQDAAIQTSEVEIDLRDLQPGMVLSRDLFTIRDTLLLPQDSKPERHHSSRLFNDNEADPVVGSVYVYRNAGNRSGSKGRVG